MKINVLQIHIPYFIFKNACFVSLCLTDILDFYVVIQRDTDDIFHSISTAELFKGSCLRDKGHCSAKGDLQTTQQSHIATGKFETEGKL